MRLIDADALKKVFHAEWDDVLVWDESGETTADEFCNLVDTAPTIEPVKTGACEQIKWERDVAIEQLKSIGKGLGEKMDDVKPVKTGKWIYDTQFHWYRSSCSECGYMRTTDIKADNWNGWKYCPNCGARLEREDDRER